MSTCKIQQIYIVVYTYMNTMSCSIHLISCFPPISSSLTIHVFNLLYYTYVCLCECNYRLPIPLLTPFHIVKKVMKKQPHLLSLRHPLLAKIRMILREWKTLAFPSLLRHLVCYTQVLVLVILILFGVIGRLYFIPVHLNQINDFIIFTIDIILLSFLVLVC